MRRWCDPVLFGRLGARHCPKRIPGAGTPCAPEPTLTQVAKRETIMKITLSRSSSFLLVLVALACIGLPVSGQDTSFLTNGLVGHWSFDEGQGTTANDLSGNGNNGVIHPGATWSEGKIGRALHFNGNTDSMVQVPSSASLNVSTGLTITAWVNLEYYDFGDHVIVCKWNDLTQQHSYIFKAWPSIDLNKTNNVPLAGLYLSGKAPPLGTWTHLAMTFDSVTSLVRIYKNGVPIGEGQTTGGEIQPSQAELWFGHLMCGWGEMCEALQGLMDEVRIYSRGLSETQVLTLYNYEKSLTLTNMAPVILSQPAGTSLHVGDTAQLSVAANGTWPLAYQWRKDSGVLGGRTNATLSLANVSLTDTGDYTVVVTNTFGAITSAIAKVTVSTWHYLPLRPPVFAGGMMTLSWPAMESVRLQRCTNLTFMQWQDVPQSTLTNRVILPITDAIAFFRLAGTVEPITLLARGFPLVNPGTIVLSPNGSMAYIYDWGASTIFVMPVGGGTPSVLTSYATTQFGGLQQARWMAISPDGQILYLAGWGSSSVFSVSVASGTCTNLASGAPLVSPHGITVSPDGNTLYFTDNSSGGVLRLPAKGGIPVVLNPDAVFQEPLDIAISPSGDTLFVTDGGAPAVYRIPAVGGTPTVMVSGPPLVRPTGLGISSDGSTLIIVDDAGLAGQPPPAVYSLPTSGGPLHLLYFGEPLWFPSDLVFAADGISVVVTDPGYLASEGSVYRIQLSSPAP
jgi:DNA-binding beta-propeller fold protein YncE